MNNRIPVMTRFLCQYSLCFSESCIFPSSSYRVGNLMAECTGGDHSPGFRGLAIRVNPHPWRGLSDLVVEGEAALQGPRLQERLLEDEPLEGVQLVGIDQVGALVAGSERRLVPQSQRLHHEEGLHQRLA